MEGRQTEARRCQYQACQEEGPVWLEHRVDVREGIDKIGTGLGVGKRM